MHSFHTQLLVLMFAGILAKLHPSDYKLQIISEVVFRCGCFLTTSSNISKTPFFLEHLFTMASISSIEKDSIAVCNFKPPSYCFEETIGFDVKTSFASRPESRLIR